MAKISKLNNKQLKKLMNIKTAYSYKDGANSYIVLYKNSNDLKHVYHVVNNRDDWSMVQVTEVIYSLLHKKGKKKIIIQDEEFGELVFYPSNEKRDIFRTLSRMVRHYNKNWE